MLSAHSFLQRDDPPEQVGPFLYFTRSNLHGQDTILRRCTASGGQQVVLSAGIMQQDAAQVSRLLGVEVHGALGAGWCQVVGSMQHAGSPKDRSGAVTITS
jgi:hypothetical protein